MVNYYKIRLDKLQDKLLDFEALFLNNTVDISYLTGFTGDDSYLLITKRLIYFITDGRYLEQIKMEKQVELIIEELKSDKRLLFIISKIIKESQIKGFLFFKKDISLDFFESLQNEIKDYPIEYKNNNFIKEMRMCKDELEIEILRENLIITELGYNYIVRLIKEGMKESEIAAELEYFLRKRGANKQSFETIIASGHRTALPHGIATEKKIKKDDLIMFDFGIRKNGYCSDFTRCYIFGKIYSQKIREIHSIVLDALKTAQNVIKSGIKANYVHKTAYDLIEKAGYASNFWHSTGHGVGMEIHELPAISFNDETVLEEGMVFTIEPGIYIPGTGGIRLEDMVVVRKNGCEVLTETDYDL